MLDGYNRLMLCRTRLLLKNFHGAEHCTDIVGKKSSLELCNVRFAELSIERRMAAMSSAGVMQLRPWPFETVRVVLRTTNLLGSAHVLAVRPRHTGRLFVSSHAVFLSSFFRFVVLV
jgi:hypothetical protein